MFSITADGILYHHGTRIGRIQHQGTYSNGARLEYVVRGVDVTEDGTRFGETVFTAHIASGGTEHRSV